MAEKATYDQQYCKKHDQHYAGFLNACPICVGEKLGEEISKQFTNEVKGDIAYE